MGLNPTEVRRNILERVWCVRFDIVISKQNGNHYDFVNHSLNQWEDWYMQVTPYLNCRDVFFVAISRQTHNTDPEISYTPYTTMALTIGLMSVK